ncbi:recombinase RecA [Roseateles sp. PN1]|uniref:recombinase RecA n=1 Tax=Roseateles sp. PN1 TaxID=3137372 RepID=UPI003138A9E3
MLSTATLRPAEPAQALLHAQVWRANSLGSSPKPGLSSGFAALDAQLPGAGWPSHALSEILQPPHTQLEWRLLGPALRALLAPSAPHTAAPGQGQAKRPQLSGRAPMVLLINPPYTPHLPGLQAACGAAAEQLLWIAAGTAQQQLWATEQAIKANAAAAILAWLPQARPEQIRRLQSHAQSCSAPVFLLRPLAAHTQASAAPLRVSLSVGADWCLQVQILKRRGPTHEQALLLPALPAGLQEVLSPRMLAQPWPSVGTPVAPIAPLMPTTPVVNTPAAPQIASSASSAGSAITSVSALISHALARPAQPATSAH